MKVAVITNTSKPQAVEFQPKVIDKLINMGVTPVDCIFFGSVF